MTLASSFLVNDHPCVVADMLVSLEAGSEEQPGLQLPTSGDVNNLPNERTPVHGLRQKISILADNLVIAIAGEISTAMKLTINLRNLGKNSTLAAADVEKYFIDNQNELTGVAVVGHFMEKLDDGNFAVHCLRWNAQTKTLGFLQQVSVAGTGAKLLNMAVEEFDGYVPEPGLRGALHSLLSLTGALIRSEHADGSPIVDAKSGGSYEIAYFDGQQFVKIPEVTYIIWDAEIKNDGEVEIKFPYLILRQIYVKENAVINVARIDASENHCKYVAHTHLVPQTHRATPTVTFGDISKEQLGFNSQLTVHSILITSTKGVGLQTIMEQGRSLFQCHSIGENGFVHKCDPKLLEKIRQAALSANGAAATP